MEAVKKNNIHKISHLTILDTIHDLLDPIHDMLDPGHDIMDGGQWYHGPHKSNLHMNE